MDIELTADAYEDALPDNLLNELYDKGFSDFFLQKDFGNNTLRIFIVIVCYPKELKVRKRYSAERKTLYWDVILNYEMMKKSNMPKKKNILANAIVASFDILNNYKRLHIDTDKLKSETKQFFVSIGWIK